MKKLILLATVICISYSSIAQNSTKDEQDLRNIFKIMETGWNTKNGEVFSSHFADVHDYVVVNGLYFPNFTRKQNGEIHQQLFQTTFKTSDIKLVVDKVNFIRPDLSMINVIGGMYEKGENAPTDPGVIMTILAEKKAGGWKIISFHNHALQPIPANAPMPVPAKVMYASWYKN